MSWVFFGLVAFGAWAMFRDIRAYLDRRFENIEQRLEVIRQIVNEPKRRQLEEDDHWRPD
ncbi:hypothetical protein EN814_18920 [Mesorhizobium sp. M2D.F.Ca.ET.171.01.1.1]|uniref:hypothetical protein n=1 Tax=unclassified Mesorhizobium TaxID=325217 RepID=UPI00109188B2|nr:MULTISPECIES: hypothetical protein [unclassified Mesorhizobium]TGS94776.1 hypothetical protein EN821_18935 [Mesorhizobium sp. M2D.F.Ca.ET.178.01.1.1]TGT10558.1 hypothetical protein EN814_18920 [Mesorhizobium sp. M2D.F.Ca.ET.171.01.1.1]